MKRYGVIGILLLVAIAGVSLYPRPQTGLPVTIMGDVAEVVSVAPRDVKLQSFSVDGKSYRGVELTQALKLAGVDQTTAVMFIGDDGHAAMIDSMPGLENSWLAAHRSGWQFVSATYPINSWIKDIRKMIVVGRATDQTPVIRLERDVGVISPGRILAAPHMIIPAQEGRASKAVDGVTYNSYVLRLTAGVALSELLPVSSDSQVLIMGTDGSALHTTADSVVTVQDRSIHVQLSGGSIEIGGVIVDPPHRSITDVHDHVLGFIDNDEQVMAIIVDGLGWQAFLHARALGLVSALTLGTVEPALSVYPPITPVAVAAMLCGQLPPETGIGSRNDRELLLPTVLDRVIERGKRAVLIEGMTSPIAVPGDRLILNADKNGNGCTDDEILESALAAVAEGYDLIVVHFHSVDDMGHASGPLAQTTLDQIHVVDTYISRLLSVHQGPVIIVADHGMHKTEDGGHHGRICREDMFVPYIVITPGGAR